MGSEDGEPLATMERHFRSIRCLAISEKEGAIFSAFGDNKIKAWDLKTGNLLATMEGHSNEITCLAISEKEGAIFSGFGDNKIKKWDLKTGNLLATMERHSNEIRCHFGERGRDLQWFCRQ